MPPAAKTPRKRKKRAKATSKKKAKKKTPRSRKLRHPKVPKSRILNAADERAASRGYWFDPAAAADAVDFFETLLHHSKGKWAGKPFELMPWQKKELVEPLFGWMHPVEDEFGPVRRFTQAYVEVPKKNGKTETLAGIQLYLLMADGEQAAEVYCAAKDRKQAGILYRATKLMVLKSPAIAAHLRCIETTKHIVFDEANSFFCALSGDAGGNEGLDAHSVTVDELHVLRTRELWDTLLFSGAARRQPLNIAITTAGWDRESICWEQHEYASKVRSGELDDDRFLGIIYGYEDCSELDILDPEVHRKANPSYGVLIKPEEMMAEARKARANPKKLFAFWRYRLGGWTESAKLWLSPEDWAKSAPTGKASPQDWRAMALEALKGKRCFAGLDLGATRDLTALVFLFPDGLGDDPRPVLMPWFWAPREGTWTRHASQRVLYRTWRDQGFMDFTEGNITDLREVRQAVNKRVEDYQLQDLAIDRVLLGYELCTSLGDDGIEMVAFGQGHFSMAAPCRRFEELTFTGGFNHGNNPILAWMARNAAAKEDAAGNVKPVKPSRNSGRKIDGIVASLMALGRWMLTGEEKTPKQVIFFFDADGDPDE